MISAEIVEQRLTAQNGPGDEHPEQEPIDITGGPGRPPAFLTQGMLGFTERN